MIPLSEPCLEGNEWAYVKECLDTKWVSSAGPFVGRFEQLVADYVGTTYGVATCNGTSALHIALLVAGVEPDDEVLVPAFAFVAPANAVKYCRAHPVFLDVTADTGNLSLEMLQIFLHEECEIQQGVLVRRRTGRRVYGVLPVHSYGHPVDMLALRELAGSHRLAVVEDAAESLGAMAHSKRVGADADLVCFSFNGNKVITTGGGGMIVTRNAEWANRARHLTTQAKAEMVEYRHDTVGFNYRMPSINAALGVAQMEQMDALLRRKRVIAEIYQRELASIEGIRVCGEASWALSSYWLVNIFVDKDRSGISARKLRAYLEGKKIDSRLLWYPLHRQPAHADCEAYRITVADQLWEQGLSLPSSPRLTESEVVFVCAAVRQAVEA